MVGKKIFGGLTVTAIILLLIFSISLSSPQFYDRRESMEQSTACLDCHEDYEATLAGTAHRLSSEGDLKSSMFVNCINCHDGWEKHLDDPSVETIEKLDGLASIDQAEVCGRCHQTAHQQAMESTDPHFRSDISCLDCHAVHNNPRKMLVKDEEQNFCLSCHNEVKGEFHRRSNHPLQSANIRCTDCHKIDGIKDHGMSVGHDWNCQSCHSDYAGPFLYEHPVVYDHLVEGGGCIECHQPHGSPNDRLLNQPQNGTCLQCHGTPPGHRLNHDGLGTKLACVDCHSEIHGSYDNRLFLDPDLGNKLFPDCYQSGCHNLNR